MNRLEGIHPLIIDRLRNAGHFNDDEIVEVLGYFDKRCIKRKDFILRSGEVARFRAYINKGCFRRYTIDEHGKEVIINFAFEEWWTGDLESYQKYQPSIYFVQALEDSEVFCISEENSNRLYEEVPKFRDFEGKKRESSHFATLKRLTFYQSATQEEKYLALLQKYPQLFQRVPLHYIASYLGMEPESLSRLRKRLCKKEKKS